jgi:SAM-dependent methyltransferase
LALEGYAVIGTDISQTALDQAKALAANYEGLTLEFQYDDVLDSQLSPGSFDAIFDRGCFHSLYGFIGASGYTNGVLRLLKPGGILVLKMMNDAEKRFRQVETIDGKSQTMPYHFRRDELDGLFGPPFRYLEITETVFQSSVVRPDPIAWMVVLRNEA